MPVLEHYRSFCLPDKLTRVRRTVADTLKLPRWRFLPLDLPPNLSRASALTPGAAAAAGRLGAARVAAAVGAGLGARAARRAGLQRRAAAALQPLRRRHGQQHVRARLQVMREVAEGRVRFCIGGHLDV